MTNPTVDRFRQQGVIIPDPATVTIGPEIKPERIAAGAVLHPGCRIEGAQTSIGPGSEIGREGPAVVRDCQLGHNVSLGAGFFEGSVFLNGAAMGGGAHVRPGCLLEEQASGAHTVGLKQTVLMSYVTLGSLINFCDCLMAGGTSRKNHSEVGSSYIHFNFTPRQDKATASLIGDVPHGVLLNQPPVFLGGQGGLAGPCRIAFGVIVAAGQIIRNDLPTPNQLVTATTPAGGAMPFDPTVYRRIKRIVANNLAYIGNILALRVWYQTVRREVMDGDPFNRACREGAVEVLNIILDERIKRLAEVAARMPASIAALERTGETTSAPGTEVANQRAFHDGWPALAEQLAAARAAPPPPLPSGAQGDYAAWIAGLTDDTRAAITDWLGGIVARVERVGCPAL